MSSLAEGDDACPCHLDPTSSICSVWANNESACGYVQNGLRGSLP
jgi:hypothetical protein